MVAIISKTEKNEYFQTENITREAFWNLYKPGCDEHFVLHQLRKSESYIEELDFIAAINGEIVGHIISTRAKVIDSLENETEVLCVGPVSVLPVFQNSGIGTMLIRHSISIAGKFGFKGMILFGNPDYYHRFGFRNAADFAITTKNRQNFDPFMVLELVENGLDDVKGRFFEDAAFETCEKDVTEFEKRFPFKEKRIPKIEISQLQ